MIKLYGNRIYLTRGDTALLKVVILGADKEVYTPDDTDTVTLTVKKTTNSADVLFQREVVDGMVEIKPEDTASLPYGDYIYDVCLETKSGIVQTFIPPTVFKLTEEVNF